MATLETPERDARRVQDDRAELIERIGRATPGDGMIEPLPDLRLRRVSAPTAVAHGVSATAFCVTAQGSKEVMLGDRIYRYDPAHYLIATATLPVTSRIVDASPEQPFLNLLLQLDPTLVGSVMVEAGFPAPRSQPTATAMATSTLEANLLDAVVRLVRLLETPAEARVLAPLIKREIVYRLLMGEQGERLRHFASLGGADQPIARAVQRLRRDFDQPLRMDDLARDLGMSTSGFHHHFKQVTAMSPLQFQKQLRLQEARRLMLGGALDAASAGFQVGYNDAAQFTREYKRFFGEPPMRDVERLRGTVIEIASV